jgi:uncharacterized protein YodC (DUF2158 family)
MPTSVQDSTEDFLHAYVVGDTVQLKSGGPEMTVASLQPPSETELLVWTKWFVNGEVRSANFPAAALKRVASASG